MSIPSISQPIPTVPLGHTEKRLWPADPGAYGGRKARRPGAYEVFIPDEISGRDFPLDGDAVAAVTEATRALQHLEASPPRIATLGALAQNLLRSESVASSRIEGVHLSHKRLARAAYQADRGQRDRRAAEVLGNVEAMKHAIEIGTAGKPLTTSDIEDIHRTLLRFTEDADIAGVVRESQNWIGGNDYNPIGAAYVPPPPEYVRPLLDDVCAFATRTDLAPIVQAGIVHAQFETIHPFADGNGRVGRALDLRGPSSPWRDPQLHPSDQPHPGGGAEGVRRRAHFVPRGRRQLMDRAVRRRDCTGGDRGRATRRRDRAAPINLARRPRPATPGRRRPPAHQCAAAAARDRRRGRPDAHRQVPRHRRQGSARARARGNPAEAQRAQVGPRLGVRPAAQLGR